MDVMGGGDSWGLVCGPIVNRGGGQLRYRGSDSMLSNEVLHHGSGSIDLTMWGDSVW